MKSLFRNQVKYFFPFRPSTRLLLVIIDLFIITFTLFLIDYSSTDLFSFDSINLLRLNIAIILGLIIYILTGQYKALSSYVSSKSFYLIIYRNCLLIIIILFLGFVFNYKFLSKYESAQFFFLINSLSVGIRVILRDLLLGLRFGNNSTQIKVAIYGAGEAGAQLCASLKTNRKYKIVNFFDDNKKLWNRELMGIPIYAPSEINKSNNKIDQLLISIPSLTRNRRKEILESLEGRGITILQIPTLEDISSGKARIDSLRPIEIEDLLGRDPSKPIKELLEGSISGRVICVTGAGGTIGAELCRQILNYAPEKLILVEQNEPSLYLIQQELCEKSSNPVNIKYVLGDASNFMFIKKLFLDECVSDLYHAAAYKHVPMAELNPLSTISNNIGSTIAICNAAIEANIERVILISTDKAVRPTNLMGATKRLSELIFQAHAEEFKLKKLKNKDKKIKFSMVRFGNVLGSSGSVVPLFKKQISRGGPVTLTHQEIIRYFMTISEAVELVLQASELAKGGEVFLLDMGKPIKILDLAKKMIILSGLEIKNINNPEGDIEIKFTGLRPGEKLYEELLIDGKAKATKHNLIFKAEEEFIPSENLWPVLNNLQNEIKEQNIEKALDILKKLVPEWQRNI